MEQNFVLFGCGNMGLKHLTKLLEIFENSKFIVCEPRFHNHEIYAHPNVTVVNDFEEISDLSISIDSYIIASPSEYHLDLFKRVIRKGVNILIEKPVGINPLLRTDLLKEAARAYCKVTTGFIERYSAAAYLLNHIIKTKKISELVIIRESHACPTDTDVVEDLMIHDIDLLCYLGVSLIMNDIKFCYGDGACLRDVAGEFNGLLANGEQLKISLHARHSLPVTLSPKRLMKIKLINGASISMNLANNEIEFNTDFAEILLDINDGVGNKKFIINGSVVEWPDKLLLEHQQAFAGHFDLIKSKNDIEIFNSVISVISSIRNVT